MSGITFVFVPPCTTVGRDRRVRAGVELAGHADRQRLEGADEPRLVEQRGRDLLGVAHAATKRRQMSCSTVGGRNVGEPAYDLGRGDEGVVGPVRLRRVPRRAPDAQRAPVAALLADDHRQLACRSGDAIGKPPASVMT